MAVITTFTPPADGIVHQQTATKAFMNDREIGCGTIYITENALSWWDGLTCMGLSLSYLNISVHAVQREPSPALYVMVDHKIELPGAILQEDAVSDSEEEEEGTALTELRFIPNDTDMLQRMYTALCECQALHPDPQDDDSDIYEDASESMDDEMFEPTMEYMENEPPIGDGNGHQQNGGDIDPDQFADD